MKVIRKVTESLWGVVVKRELLYPEYHPVRALLCISSNVHYI